jgi:hypothetical protein
MFLDPAPLRDPHERVREMLRAAPSVFWTPRNGGHSVINGMEFGIHHLACHPAFQQQLRANAVLIIDATEELLRRYTFAVPVRRVAHDTDWTI